MKKIILMITGSIAAPKALDLYYLLKKTYEVTVIATPSAKKFVKFPKDMIVYDKYLEQDFYHKNDKVIHANLALNHDLIVVYPATMNFISKAALAICDNLALATFLASNERKIIFPAMNHNMYHNQGLQNNLKLLKQDFKVEVIEPDHGLLACQVVGDGRLKAANDAFSIIENYQQESEKLLNKTVLINLGATRSYLDDIKYITTNSSGKMGLELIKAFLARGAKVIAIVGDISVALIKDENLTVVRANTNQLMFDEMNKYFKEADIVFSVASVNDYQLTKKWKGKINKIDYPSLKLELVTNIDVLKLLGQKKQKQILIGFSAQENDDLSYGISKMITKNCDGIVINHINTINQDDTKVKFYLKNKLYYFDGRKNQVAKAIVNLISLM